jgi:hypothetical protein
MSGISDTAGMLVAHVFDFSKRLRQATAKSLFTRDAGVPTLNQEGAT